MSDQHHLKILYGATKANGVSSLERLYICFEHSLKVNYLILVTMVTEEAHFVYINR